MSGDLDTRCKGFKANLTVDIYVRNLPDLQGTCGLNVGQKSKNKTTSDYRVANPGPRFTQTNCLA